MISLPRIIDIKGDIISNDNKWFYNWFEMDSTCPNDVIKVLNEVNGSEDIEIHMNSGGGSVIPADEIYTALATYQGNVEIIVVGMAGSAASEILTACKSKISPVGKVMIHNCSTRASGDYRDMDSASNMLKTVNQSIRNAYKAKTNLTDEQLSELMDNETWMSAEEAVQYGFVDEIMETNMSNVTNSQVKTIYNSINHIFNQDKIKELHKMVMENNISVNKPIGNQTKIDDQQALFNTKKEEKGGITNMTLEDIRNQYPDVANQIDSLINSAKEEGAEEERGRIKNIFDIAQTVPETKLVEAMFDKPCTAQELALSVLKDSAKDGETYLRNAVKDSKKSGADDVIVAPKDSMSSEEDDDEALINMAANSANRGRKGIK